jgi:tripartite-type tricarboxylate transporter receptor subunit TctC
MILLRPILISAALAFACTQAGKAQDTIDRPVTIYVAGTAGGGIDLYARLVSRHIGRHIPGKPAVTVQVMPGAGGIRAANYLAEQAPRDGTAITTFAGGPILEPLIGARNPGYDMSSFTWIGAITKDMGLCIAWGATPFKTIDDVRQQQMVVAGTGAGSETDTWPIVLNEVLGTKFKLVTGYVGTQETILAIERGEAHGRCVFSYSALKIAKPDWLRDKKINVLVLTALERSPDFPSVPPVSISSPSRRTVSCSNSWLGLQLWRGHLQRRLLCRPTRPRCCGAPSMRPCRTPNSAPRRSGSRRTLRRQRVRRCKSWSRVSMRPRGRWSNE